MKSSDKIMMEMIKFGAPCSSEEAAKLAGVSVDVARRVLTNLRDNGKVHISGWEKRNTAAAAIYSVGRGRDAPRPLSKELVPRDNTKPRYTGLYIEIPPEIRIWGI